jgi:hypothetical protein
MDQHHDKPMAEYSTDALFRMLGVAWIDQLKPQGGDVHFLASSLEAGTREFGLLVPALRRSLNNGHVNGIAACVGDTIQQSATWPMPAHIVMALAVRLQIATAPSQDEQPHWAGNGIS